MTIEDKIDELGTAIIDMVDRKVVNKLGDYYTKAETENFVDDTLQDLTDVLGGNTGESSDLGFALNDLSNLNADGVEVIKESCSEQMTELNNPSRSYLVETYENGNSWYRLYSDGWCEQGAYIPWQSVTTDTLIPFTLLKPLTKLKVVSVIQEQGVDGTFTSAWAWWRTKDENDRVTSVTFRCSFEKPTSIILISGYTN